MSRQQPEQRVPCPRQPTQCGRSPCAHPADAPQPALATQRNAAGPMLVSHATQHADQAAPGLHAELRLQMGRLLPLEPACPKDRIQRRPLAEPAVVETIQCQPLAPGTAIVRERAHARVDERCAEQWRAQLAQNQCALDAGPVQNQRGTVVPGGIAEPVETGASGIEVTANARPPHGHASGRAEAAVEAHRTLNHDAVERQRRTAATLGHRVAVELTTGVQITADACAAEAYLAHRLEAVDKPHVAADAQAIGHQRATRCSRLTAATQIQSRAIQVASDLRTAEPQIVVDHAPGVQRQVVGNGACLCHQSREMAAGKDGGSRHARPIEQHRRIELAAIEPQAAGNRCVSQVEPAFDPCTHELQPPPAQRQPATSNEGQQRSPDAGLRRRPLGPAQADLGDVAGRTGPHQQSLGTTQPAEAVEGSDLRLCRRWTRGDESRRCACAVGGLHTPSFCVRRCALRGLPPPGSRGLRPGCHANPPRVRGRSARSETRSATAKARHRCPIHAERMRPRRCGCLRRIHRADRGC